MFEAGIRRNLAQQEGQRVIMPKEEAVKFAEGMAEVRKHVGRFVLDWNDTVGQPEWWMDTHEVYTRWGGAVGRAILYHEVFPRGWGMVFEYRYQKSSYPDSSFSLTTPDSMGQYLQDKSLGSIIDDWLHTQLREGWIGPHGRYITKLNFWG